MSQEELKHYGILRKSGRYPWDSGKDPATRSRTFYGMVEDIKRKNPGIAEADIAKAMGLSVSELRSTKTIAREQIVNDEIQTAKKLREAKHSPGAIAEKMGIPVATVRLRLRDSENLKESTLRKTADVLKANVLEHKIVDIGKGIELHLGVADTKLKAAVALLNDEGFETYTIKVKQPGANGQFTNQKVIVPPGTTFAEARKNVDKIHTMTEWTEDGGKTFLGIHPPLAVSSKRLAVNFAEDGGTDADGAIYIRPGVEDLSMGKNRYVQARISIDGTHYIKGMAIYKDDLPPGVDIVFNTNKSRDVGKLGALKPMKNDVDNPFGSIIKRQIVEIDPKTGQERVKSALNIVNEEGDWDTWRKSLPSQMLAKQPHSLIKSQLKLTRDEADLRLSEIASITNPVIRKKKLDDYASQLDADAVDLRAAAMPNQRSQVIIPIPGMSKTEVYAPQFNTGDPVVLIRYPHGGRFEIPELTVNNNSRKAKSLLGNATDAVGIHPSVAERLSGADFDGDAVVVIPNRAGKIKGSASMGREAAVFDTQLKNFDPKQLYGGFKQTGTDKNGNPVGNFKLMRNTGLEMGMITNLITDMSIQGAKPEHVVRAVKHSMVVIDAEKHSLNYRQSAIDNGITQLKTLYQGKPNSGATTLLSQATAKTRVNERALRKAQDGGPIDKKTGALVYVETGNTRSKYDAKNKAYLEEREAVTQNIKRLALTDNAYDLVRDSKDPVERMYADHANEMKARANQTRLAASKIAMPKMNPAAKAVYKDDVDDLVAQLRKAQMQKPLDRKAQVIAVQIIKQKRDEDPTLREDKDRMKKVERQAVTAARARLGLTRPEITISDRQWDAIQSHAVSSSRLREIIEYVDPKRIETLSMPRPATVMTPAIVARAKAMLAAGGTNADVAASLGVPKSTLSSAFREA